MHIIEFMKEKNMKLLMLIVILMFKKNYKFYKKQRKHFVILLVKMKKNISNWLNLTSNKLNNSMANNLFCQSKFFQIFTKVISFQVFSVLTILLDSKSFIIILKMINWTALKKMR